MTYSKKKNDGSSFCNCIDYMYVSYFWAIFPFSCSHYSSSQWGVFYLRQCCDIISFLFFFFTLKYCLCIDVCDFYDNDLLFDNVLSVFIEVILLDWLSLTSAWCIQYYTAIFSCFSWWRLGIRIEMCLNSNKCSSYVCHSVRILSAYPLSTKLLHFN